MAKVLVRRHSGATRLTHWVNVLAVLFLLMSGLQIFNAHPALYWGAKSHFDRPWLLIGTQQHAGRTVGITRIAGHDFVTDGVLGHSGKPGAREARAFPAWATVPSWRDLATGRRWHFFFAWVLVLNGLIYLAASLVGGHIRRDLWPTRDQLKPGHVWHEIVEHARLRFPKGEAAKRYNVLQKLAYLGVALVALPLMVATGLTMSPGFDAAAPWLLELFGGRQSARSIHFICAGLVVLFVIVHLVMVVASGVWNNIRSMITGRYAIELEGDAPMSAADRRSWLRGAAAGLAGLSLAACDRISQAGKGRGVLERAEGLTRKAQRLLVPRTALAREYGAADVSGNFQQNGSTNPQDPAYRAHVANGFADWKLVVDGLVERPMQLSLAELRAQPSRTQITRHDCVEGWSDIAKWQGARLGPLLDRAGIKPQARYIVFHCADNLGQTQDASGLYYESIDLVDAYHPQTILAYAMNDAPLPVAHGAPVRLRVERQLGYKQAKYVMRLEAVADFGHIGRGKGGFWEDRGYEWYAGI